MPDRRASAPAAGRDRMGLWIRLGALALLAATGAPAFAQYPGEELSFNSLGPYIQEYMGGTAEQRAREEMETPPTIECVGIALHRAPRNPDYAPAIEANLDARAAAAIAAFQTGNYAAALESLRPGVAQGDAHSVFALGCIMEGLARARFKRYQYSDAPPHPQRAEIEQAIQTSRTLGGVLRPARHWLILAADAGFVPARWELARRWSNFWVIYPSFVAVDRLRQLADAGDARAAAILGHLYLFGQSVARDLIEAAALIRRSADAGDEYGMLMLSNLYREGRGVPRDVRQSFEWLGRAAAAGNARGRHWLGLAYRDGEGTSRNPEQAARLFGEAAAQGDGEAAFDLGMLYAPGGGMPEDMTLSRRWIDRAAELGSCRARIEQAERRVAAGEFDTADDQAKAHLLDILSRCHSPFSPARDLAARPTNRVEESELQGRSSAIATRLGRGGPDWAQIRAAFESGETDQASAALAALVAQARAFVEHSPPPGFGGAPAGEALAILAFPARWLPEAVRAQIDSPHWLAQIQALPLNHRSNIVLAALSSPLVQPDLPVMLALVADPEDRGERERADILRRLGLSGAPFIALLRRADRGENPETIQQNLWAMTFNCTSAHHFARFVAAMRSNPRSCSNVEGLAQLPTAALRRLGDLGAADALMFLAERYLEGRGVERDPQRAIETLRELTGPLPEATLGVIYEEGRGVAPDPARAAAYYQARLGERDLPFVDWSEPGRATLQARLGLLLLNGLGVPADPNRATPMLRVAAAAGVIIAETGAGDAFYLGAGVQRDEAEALRWYRQAAAHGDASALVRFGFLAATGRWRERDIDAAQWFALAEYSDEAVVYLDLARAEAYGPRPRVEEVRRWLRRAAAKHNMWAVTWLHACHDARVACFRAQPGFGRLFFTELAAAPDASRQRRAHVPARRAPSSRLSADLEMLEGEMIAADRHGEGNAVFLALMERRERLETYHGDAESALATRLRRVLFEDSLLRSRYGSLNSYFALVDSSCNWGLASEAAQRLGRREAALFFAKVAVNRLQEARAYLEGLDEEIRECFLDAHRDRYRWLADLLIRADRLAEAEAVLGMLKDFEHASYANDRSRQRSSRRQLPYTQQEQAVIGRMTRLTAALIDLPEPVDAPGAAPGEAPGETGAIRSDGEAGFQREMDEMLREIALMDLRSDRPRSGIRVEQVATAQRSVMVDLTRRFPSGTVALHAVVLDDRMHWLITTARGRNSLRIDGPVSEIDGAIRDLLEAIHTRAPFVQVRAKALYDRVFAPVDRELRRLGAHYVMLSLDARLRYVPFAALHDGEQWLVETYSFSHFRQPQDYLRSAAGAAPNIAAFGSSTAIDGHEPLPGVARELGGIVRTDASDQEGILTGIERLDGAFTRDALAAGLASDFRMIHIASHFVLSIVESDASYLLLGDGGRLALQDFRLDGRFTFAHADLVTLSACQTAVAGRYGSGLEIDSLATIVQDAGAPAVIASLWSVADPSTADLMLGFYARRIDERLPLSEALRRAQLDLIAGAHPAGAPARSPDHSGAPYDHPYYWAPFIVMGNWQ